MKKLIFAALAAMTFGLASCGGGFEKWEPPTPGPNTGGGTEIIPAAEKWAALADSCTLVLTSNFLDVTTGTFWASVRNGNNDSYYIYWQQAHAMDVLIYSYMRIKDSNPMLAKSYVGYFDNFVKNYANNYNTSHRSEGNYGGFFNDWTDDMAWLCLTLIHLSEATGSDSYADIAKNVYDRYIWTRSTKCDKGVCLPWTNHDEDKTNFNACTNCPSCLVAALLYQRYNEASYLTQAKDLYAFNVKNMPSDDGMVENPPLTYTQGTFGEAARVLYHITKDRSYMDMAAKVIRYAFESNRCTGNGVLRHEGTSMDQAIFKAVLIPYAVNYVLDPDADKTSALQIREKLLFNAKSLDKHLDRIYYPSMFANYSWTETVEPRGTVNMGAQASGASLMEGVARMMAAE